MKAINIAKKSFERRIKVFKNYEKIAKKIKMIAKKILKDSNLKVIVFGSVVRGSYSPLSDLDILIITKKANKIKYGKFILQIKKQLGEEVNCIEFHLVTPQIFESWYKKFIDVYKEI